MTDNSNFVLPFEIDNAAARFATGKVESKVLEEGGFKWKAAVEQCHNCMEFSLRCDGDHGGFWKCDAEVDLHLCETGGGTNNIYKKARFRFNVSIVRWQYKSAFPWSYATHPTYNVNGKFTVEFRINIISSINGEQNVDLATFAAPTSTSNVILVIGEDKLHVSKEFLAVHSPVFAAMFFGEFVEKGKEEVEIKDVDCEEFIDLLRVIYPGRVRIRDATVIHILALGDRFQMERVLELAEVHICAPNMFNTAEKLRLADQYRLGMLRDSCLHTYSTAKEIGALKSAPEYANFSDAMKAAICDRMMELVNTN